MLWGVIPIHIQIGNIKTRDVENWQVIPDDRQQRIEIIGGIAVQDFGRVPGGDKISCTATVLKAGWEIIKLYWDERIMVDIVDEAGNVWKDMRVVVKSYSYVSYFPRAIKVSFEFWRL